MIYADYSYYHDKYNSYADGIIPQEVFIGYARRASAFLDSLTFNRIAEPISENIMNAVCEIAELYYKEDQRGGISSENNDGYSVTYDTKQSIDSKATKTALIYLANTGLLYRGMG